MISVYYTARSYAPERVSHRYVRRNAKGIGYSWCEVGDNARYDIRQGQCDAEDLPEAVRVEADKFQQYAFGYVIWERA